MISRCVFLLEFRDQGFKVQGSGLARGAGRRIQIGKRRSAYNGDPEGGMKEGEIISSRQFTRAPERRPPRKPTPPRCARQPLPREGARVDTPSFLWKEVPRRGGGWMGGKRDEKEREDRLKCAVCESTLSTAARSPFPNGEGCDTRAPLSPYRQSEYMHVWKNNTPSKAFPAWGRWRAKRAG